MMNKDQIKKYQSTEKNTLMFNQIAGTYDFLNSLLSFGGHIRWRKAAMKQLAQFHPGYILDIATGTADFAIAANILKPEKIIGIDPSEKMLEIARKKIQMEGLERTIELQSGIAENLLFNNEFFDAVTIAFGFRNFQDRDKALSEIHRVLKKNGVICILEFGPPEKHILSGLFKVYFKYILPFIGKCISQNKQAYQYLPGSIQAFLSARDVKELLEEKGFSKIRILSFNLGTVHAYYGTRSSDDDL